MGFAKISCFRLAAPHLFLRFALLQGLSENGSRNRVRMYICASEERNIYKQEIGMEAVVHSSAITLVTPRFCKYYSSFIQMFLKQKRNSKNPRFQAHNAILSTHCLASVRFCHSTKFSSLCVTRCHEKGEDSKSKCPSVTVPCSERSTP